MKRTAILPVHKSSSYKILVQIMPKLCCFCSRPLASIKPMQEAALFERTPARKPAGKRQTIHTTLHLKRGVRAQLERVAEQKKLSISATGASLVEWALLQNLETQQGALFERTITRLMRERERAFNNRFAALHIRLAIEIGQTRQLVTNLLPLVPGMTQEKADCLLDDCWNAAKKNLARTFSQFAGIVQELSNFLHDETGLKTTKQYG